MEKLTYKIELAGTAQIEESFKTQKDAVDYYNSLNQGFKTNQDSIVCCENDKLEDRFCLSCKKWESD